MIVQKFGGTSVGSAGAIARLGDIVRSHASRQPIVVVSAVGGVTNQLFALGQKALAGHSYREDWERLVGMHQSILKELNLDSALVEAPLKELERLLSGIALIRELTPRTMDLLASFGERLSVRLVAAHLSQVGIAAQALEAHEAGLVTDGRFGAARPLPESNAAIARALGSCKSLPVITGYIGKDRAGNTTTLGRGGSDYSAAIFGAAMGVEEIQIWTDVDGVMSADPRLVKTARQVPVLSFAEAAELAFFGAKVLHPATMVPAIEKNIPIRVLNSFNPTHAGTAVVSKLAAHERGLKSITSKDKIAVVSIVAAPMLLQFGFLERIAEVFARHEVVVDMIATSEVSVALTTDASAPLEPVIADLAQFSEARILRELAMISIVGEELQSSLRVPAQVFQCLDELAVRVEMISYGATRNNLCFLVPRSRLSEVVQALHHKLFTPPQ